MADADIRLFDELLQGLDRLYDEQSSVAETQSFFRATAVELGGSGWAQVVEDAAYALGVIVGLDGSEVAKNRAALIITAPVREIAATGALGRPQVASGGMTGAAVLLRDGAARLRDVGHDDIAAFCEEAATTLAGER